MKNLDENGLLYLLQKIKVWDGAKVDKIDGKSLSTNDYSNEDKAALANLRNNVAGYQTEAQVNLAIQTALGDVSGLEFVIVEALPASGAKGIIYLVPVSDAAEQNGYNEFIWVNNAFEKIGTTEVDLDGYLKDTDIVAITNAEIDEIIAGITN